jgi:hypothetical protein
MIKQVLLVLNPTPLFLECHNNVISPTRNSPISPFTPSQGSGLNAHITVQLKHMATVLHAVSPSLISTLTILPSSFPNSKWVIRDKIPIVA